MAKNKPFGKFLVLAGCHREGGVTYKQGEEVKSYSDLRKFNSPGCDKFKVIELYEEAAKKEIDPETLGYSREELLSLTKDDLIQMAQDEEIETKGLTKEQLVNALAGIV